MPTNLANWLGDVHDVVPPQFAGIIVTLASVACGGLIGYERQRAQKPAGTRTLILICLGSAIFTQASLLIAKEGDRGRIAAQVVSGIGFLGAGAIIRERGAVIGVTTGAGIWATAAVGVVIGGGHVAAGVVFSLIIAATLACSKAIDSIVAGPCRLRTLEVVFEPGDGKTRFVIQGILDEQQHEGDVAFSERPDGRHVAYISYCDAHRDHRRFLADLTALTSVVRVDWASAQPPSAPGASA